MNKKEDREIFLKVNSVEPVFEGGGIKVWIDGDGHFFPCDRYTVCDPDEVRKDGIRQAIELVKELAAMQFTDKYKLFHYDTSIDIINHFSYEEIVEKLDAWKKEQKTIRVRDEVVNINNGAKMVITVPPKMSSNSVEYMSGIGKDGTVYKDVVTSSYKKTGLHVDNLDSYLEV